MTITRWHLVEATHRLSLNADYNGRPGGGHVTIGSTALTFRPHRQGSHRGETMVYRPFSADDRLKAALIAAAPELLAANVELNEAVELYLAAPSIDGMNRLTAALRVARDVCAKAEGR